ncbi:hypothetical protein ACL598_17760 [Bordetella bronchialis]|uniref:hypothetical protein n=1 Tax=Bordetella bronchialis TaxID=463025 RepID=UPI003D069B09
MTQTTKQQDAPTDADIIALARETQSADPGRDGYILPITFARALLARYAPAQDAERERDTQRIDWFDANCKRESSMRFGDEFKTVIAWAIACDPMPGATVRDAIDGIMNNARAQRAGKEA